MLHLHACASPLDLHRLRLLAILNLHSFCTKAGIDYWQDKQDFAKSYHTHAHNTHSACSKIGSGPLPVILGHDEGCWTAAVFPFPTHPKTITQVQRMENNTQMPKAH
jgi:hypothetical protein